MISRIAVKESPEGVWYASAWSDIYGYIGQAGSHADEAVQNLRREIWEHWPEERNKNEKPSDEFA